jgi:2-polyprenyl-6-methoxyphenol hydroxylase-like FAD-dependent oxidoreductase
MHAVVVGAGPAGASLAYLLAQRGIRVTLLERQTDFAREFRGEGLMPSGVDALLQMGLGAQLDALPQSRAEWIEIYQGARRVVSLEVGGAGAGPRFVSQPALLEMLVGEAGKFPAFRLERGFTVRDVLRHGGRVVGVRGDSPDGPREVRGDFVIGTDGRTSVLRRKGGLDRPLTAQVFDVVWFKVPMPDVLAARRPIRAYLGRGHFSLFLPAPDGRLQVAWIIAKGTFGELRRQGLREWIGDLAASVTPDLAAHLRAHASQITHPFLLDVVCDRIDTWSAPGILLIGDAAHPMSPVGAQGINIALRDTLIAANHLGPPLARGAAPGVLDAAARRVRDERMPEVETIQRLQQIPPRVLFQFTPVSRFLMRRVAPLLARLGLGTSLFGLAFRRFANGTTRVKLDPIE